MLLVVSLTTLYSAAFCFSVTYRQSCQEDWYESDGECRPCTSCMKGQFETRPCGERQNRLCSCHPGRFFNWRKSFCDLCTECTKGQRTAQNCTTNEDTMCESIYQVAPTRRATTFFHQTNSSGQSEQRRNYISIAMHFIWIVLIYFYTVNHE